MTGELRRLRAQSLVEQQRLKEEKAQLQQEQQRLAELRSKVRKTKDGHRKGLSFKELMFSRIREATLK